ncbi:MAG: hypothetical protein HY912_05645 [Desulfomonile tiedjei]|uniref:Uncharacterized protein n=1 Tax=Desulfomonile tiedjei TaxID=2358 RepID=A0A9D6UYX2_9BACT|nr:hypothetical protein [Desulfomonile tiedjei]
MKNLIRVVVVVVACLVASPLCFSADCGGRPCYQDPPMPPESVGPMSLPFDVPIWPTLIKTEFHILPWVSLGKASVCIPGTSKSFEIPAPCLSLKPIPVWFPWLRPVDTECNDCGAPKIP